MRVRVATEAGSSDTPNEDRVVVGTDLLVVVDGATARTDTGCVHGTAWYSDHLADAVLRYRHLGPSAALAAAIRRTAQRHSRTCDLDHPGSPSGSVGIVQVDGDHLRYLVLGDVTVVIDTGAGEFVVVDDRVSRIAPTERAAADELPIGSKGKKAALARMKRAELAARNRAGGYWIAAGDPAVVDQALTGAVPLAGVRRGAILTDGAARAVSTFALYDWAGVLDLLATAGPHALVNEVRAAESQDVRGTRWPRNKTSDDATVGYFAGFPNEARRSVGDGGA
jgi:hypothetical protein